MYHVEVAIVDSSLNDGPLFYKVDVRASSWVFLGQQREFYHRVHHISPREHQIPKGKCMQKMTTFMVYYSQNILYMKEENHFCFSWWYFSLMRGQKELCWLSSSVFQVGGGNVQTKGYPERGGVEGPNWDRSSCRGKLTHKRPNRSFWFWIPSTYRSPWTLLLLCNRPTSGFHMKETCSGLGACLHWGQ